MLKKFISESADQKDYHCGLWGQECVLYETRGSQHSTKLNITCRDCPSFVKTIAVCTIVVTIPVQSSLYHCAAKMKKRRRKVIKITQ